MGRKHTVLAIAAVALGLRFLPAIQPAEPSSFIPQPSPQAKKVAAVTKPANQPKNQTKNGWKGAITLEQEWMVIRAYIRTIYWAEGTWYPGTTKDTYRIRYTFTTFNDFSDHPDFLGYPLPCGFIPSLGQNICSAASGGGQWMPDTWRGIEANCKGILNPKAERFGPENQDRGMLCKLGQIGSYWRLMDGVATKGGKVYVNRESFNQSIYAAAPTWASLPTGPSDGLGAHGQGARSIDDVWDLFSKELEKEQRSQ